MLKDGIAEQFEKEQPAAVLPNAEIIDLYELLKFSEIRRKAEEAAHLQSKLDLNLQISDLKA